MSLDLKNMDKEKELANYTGRTATVENSTNNFKLSGRNTKFAIKKSLNFN